MAMMIWAANTWSCRPSQPRHFAGTGVSAAPRRAASGIKLPAACTTTRCAQAQQRAAATKVSGGADAHVPRRADGLASVLAIGTANPDNCVQQDEYADWFFRVTKSDHLAHLKNKMKQICDKTEIKKRYFHLDEALLRDHPEILDAALPSLDARQEVAATAVPELAAAAAAKAIAEWCRPASDITHLIFCTHSGAHMPGADLRTASLLGLRPGVQRTMLYFNGCNAGSMALRLAKDVAENNRGARVLVVCAEVTLVFFRAPDKARTDTLVVQALFGDGAGAAIVGSDPDTNTGKRPLFEMVAAAQTTVPNTERIISATMGQAGIAYRLSRESPSLVAGNIEQFLVDACRPLNLGAGDWNSLFWVVHPGGRAILDGIEAALNLERRKLAASRRVLSEYGNVSGATIIFVLDEMRRRRQRQDEDAGEWGAMVSIGPGLTLETMLLRAVAH